MSSLARILVLGVAAWPACPPLRLALLIHTARWLPNRPCKCPCGSCAIVGARPVSSNALSGEKHHVDQTVCCPGPGGRPVRGRHHVARSRSRLDRLLHG